MTQAPAEQLWLARLPAAELGEQLQDLRPGAPYAILERLLAMDFPGAGQPVDPGQWPQGRIFGPDFELRWEADGGEFRAWYSGSGSPGQGFEPGPQFDRYTDEACFLWGPSEARLPQPPQYPAAPGSTGRVSLRCRRYLDAAGRLVFYRFLEMERIP